LTRIVGEVSSRSLFGSLCWGDLFVVEFGLRAGGPEHGARQIDGPAQAGVACRATGAGVQVQVRKVNVGGSLTQRSNGPHGFTISHVCGIVLRMSGTTKTKTSARPVLANRALIEPGDAARLEGIFKVLANDTRLRLLHALVRAGELNVSQLSELVGMQPSAVSNQLQRLVDKGILSARRDGNFIWYRICDRCVVGLIDLAWCLVESSDPVQADAS
jgi:ArsR family transcriptional regulator, lead/cadmium/zinc/bismuth-responsive transcriptional repressor